MTILLWGLLDDMPLSLVYNSILKIGHPVFFLDQRTIHSAYMELSVGEKIEGVIGSLNESISLKDISSIYLRPYDSRLLYEINSVIDDESLTHSLLMEDALFSWLEITSAFVVNRPSAMASNSSKPFQAGIIQNLGFDVPDTLITTDTQAVLEFQQIHENLIYKSISSIRSIIKKLGKEHLSRLDDLVWCPTQFQEYIDGKDYRVHVVGDRIFACEIISQADDYRYASQQGLGVQIRSFDLPKNISNMCVELSSKMDLPVSGIDLRKTQDDEWYCFEVNPSPGFSYYQEQTGQPISDEIALLLTRISK